MSYLIEFQKQQKALKDAERDRKKKASSMLNNYRGGEDDVKEQMRLKALKDADRDNKKKASSNLHSYKGGEHDVKEYERAIIQERVRDKSERRLVASPEASPKPVVAKLSTGMEHLKIDVEKEDTEVSPKPVSKPVSSGQARGKYEQSLLNSPKTETKSVNIETANARKPLNIDFSFGIILLDDEPYPDVEFCEGAASVIIPHAIKQWTNETNIFCNPKAPKVIGEIDTDDWYDGDDSIRYKVKGTIPVQVFAESSAKEVEEGLKKVLKRRVSFRPVYDSDLDTVAAQTIIGDGDQQWMRVRDGMIGGLGITF